VDLVRHCRLSHGLLIADAVIAATAMCSGIPLMSKNQRDFRFISGLTLLPYP
jgi:predicted nucleic acid-binding protein